MRLLFFVCFFSITLASFGQVEFCVPGARWIYYTPSSAAPPEEYHYVYDGITSIGGFSDVKILRKETRRAWSATDIQYGETATFFRQSNDSILHFVDGEFKLMFDFNVQVGDKRVVSLDWGCSDSQDTMLIDSIGTMNYQGETLVAYYFSLLLDDQLDSLDGVIEAYYIGGGSGTYVERIGLLADHPTDLSLVCVDGNTVSEYVPATFVCCTDNELAETYPDTCNLFLNATARQDTRTELTMHQNKVLVLNAPNSTLRIYNILGKELLQERIISDNQSFDLNRLSNGILLVVVETETGRFTKKLVKTSY